MRLTLFALLLTLTTHAQTRVLFIGNSYTGANSLPTMVEDVASSAGYSFSNGSLTPGGATLYQHPQNTATYSAMASQTWDFIVFQAQSQEPAFPWGQVNYQTLPFADEHHYIRPRGTGLTPHQPPEPARSRMARRIPRILNTKHYWTRIMERS